MVNYTTAESEVKSGGTVGRAKWDACKIIRNAVEGDEDYINYPHKGLMVSDCRDHSCDCKIAIYNPTEEDKKATDWKILS